MKTFLPLLALLLLTACGQPNPPTASGPGEVTISDPWIAATPNGAQVAAGYLVIENKGDKDDRLVGATSPRAGAIEIHEMKMDGAMMSMRRIDGLTIPAHGSVQLGPGGSAHLMIMKFAQPFVGGESVPMTLKFEAAGAKEVTFTVHPGGG